MPVTKGSILLRFLDFLYGLIEIFKRCIFNLVLLILCKANFEMGKEFFDVGIEVLGVDLRRRWIRSKDF